MKSKVKIPHWKELNEIFDKNDFKLTMQTLEDLERLGYRTYYKSKHPKLYIKIGKTTHIITMSMTPSKSHNGRVILREIRRIYENERGRN